MHAQVFWWARCLSRANPLFRGNFAFFRVAARTATLPFRFAGVRTFPKSLGDQPLPAGDPLSGRLSPTFGALFWLMKIIKTGFLDFSEGDSRFFEKSYFKFYFHPMENMKIFLNFIICARWVLMKIMKYPEKIQILRMIFVKLSVKNGCKQILQPTSENRKSIKTPWWNKPWTTISEKHSGVFLTTR